MAIWVNILKALCQGNDLGKDLPGHLLYTNYFLKCCVPTIDVKKRFLRFLLFFIKNAF